MKLLGLLNLNEISLSLTTEFRKHNLFENDITLYTTSQSF